ncbi:cell envelope integrity EipB family protein [Chelativorans sp. SCAU2101]|jgi:Domain of unknown function (DUF1849).|uniref:Cell envelope integrity EipB family protein n=1 Tax=Chelativorans petroleitrophicus TaxID=2975484 RepID=A0A9X2X833_9HYPH|nr:cell envelope integrity EipB family protein [Chelativorans petroleitrophicus]MCT8989462.1 cell envelope integrity EipB family protein [Chelativorans petroleitrophicus]
MRLPRVFLAFLPAMGIAAAGTAEARTLLPHRAVYDLALAEAEDTSDIDQLTGRWVFEFSGSACQGYTLKSRIVMRFDMSGTLRIVDQQVTSFEDGAGETFRFVTKSFIDQDLDSEVAGTARTGPSGTVVEYDKPEQVKRSFAPALFPTAQLRELLDRAEAGERFYETAIFDGTEFTNDAVYVSVVVGAPQPVGQNDPERKVLGELTDDRFRPVTAAYFDGEETDGEETSDYNVSFKLHESGIQRDMLIRYADYSMTAKLTDLAIFDTDTDCENEEGQ